MIRMMSRAELGTALGVEPQRVRLFGTVLTVNTLRIKIPSAIDTLIDYGGHPRSTEDWTR
jgi:hypothetical protein